MLIKYVFYLILKFNIVFGSCINNKLENAGANFATKTGYRFVENKNDDEITYPNCEAHRIWGIIRHGSRNPGKKFISKVNNDLVNIRNNMIKNDNSKLCANDLEKLKSWFPSFVDGEEKYLVSEGVDEMIEMAERMQNRFPTLFPEQYDNSSYKFKFTKTQRTKKSFESFATGLFGRDNIRQIWYPEPLHRDPVLRFYKLCHKWKKDVDKNIQTMDEVYKFANSSVVLDTVKNISDILGVNDLTWMDVHLIFMTCAFETSHKKFGYSPWCSIFSKEAFEVFEYLEDLEYYWIDGYGHELTYQQACPAIIDLIDHINLSSPYPPTTLYFTHSGTILKLLAKLNLYKDEFKLNYEHFKRNRLWNVSKIDAFGSNIFFVAFKCADNTNKILTLHQERQVTIPGCMDEHKLCDFKKFLNIFNEDYKNCNFDEKCAIYE